MCLCQSISSFVDELDFTVVIPFNTHEVQLTILFSDETGFNCTAEIVFSLSLLG